jgi:hypothetical protein
MILEKVTGKQFTSKKEVFDFLFSLGYKCNFSIANDHLKRYGSSVELASHEFKVNFAFQDYNEEFGCGTFLYAIYSPKYDVQGVVSIPEEAYCSVFTHRLIAKLKMKTIKQALFP